MIEDYYNVFQKYRTVFELEQDFPVLDWKTVVAEVIRKPISKHFKFAKAKKNCYLQIQNTKYASILVRGESAYNLDIGAAKKVFKRNLSATDVVPMVA